MELCDYGCGREGKYKFKNGKICCEKTWQSCLTNIQSKSGENNISKRQDVKEKKRIKLLGHILSEETKNKISASNKGRISPRKGVILTEETKNKISQTRKERKVAVGIKNPKYKKRLTIEEWKNKYPVFSKVEEMRYNPYKLEEKEIQVHCKNHNCQNSKEKNGWFTPNRRDITERVRAVEIGNDGCYFYCSEKCKQECPLYDLRSDPFENKTQIYTDEEYKTFRKEVLKRDNYKCVYCENIAEHVHHTKPQKLEPFFSLDPDYAISVCKECHYKYGHKDDCSTTNIGNIICL